MQFVDKASHIITVLIVEDEKTLRDACCDVLSMFGYRILLAANGEEAVRLVEQHSDHVDCVLLDMSMPGMSGIETYHAVRAIKPDLPVVITSGHDAAHVLGNFPVNGVADYVQKPYGMRELYEKLRQVIAAQRLAHS